MRPIDADALKERITEQIEIIYALADTDEELILIGEILKDGFLRQIDLEPTITVE